jgi:hypothetical protein
MAQTLTENDGKKKMAKMSAAGRRRKARARKRRKR